MAKPQPSRSGSSLLEHQNRRKDGRRRRREVRLKKPGADQFDRYRRPRTLFAFRSPGRNNGAGEGSNATPYGGGVYVLHDP